MQIDSMVLMLQVLFSSLLHNVFYNQSSIFQYFKDIFYDYTLHMYRYFLKPEKDDGFSGFGVTFLLEVPDVDAES